MEKTSRIFVAGHRGLVGSAITRCLEQKGYRNLILVTRTELDLLNTAAVTDFFVKERPEYVFLTAARVGGIHANSRFPAQFIYENLVIQTNVIHQSYQHHVRKLLFLGSSCIYPKHCPQPIREEYLLSGYLEPTNEPYAIAKIAGIRLCQSYNRQYGTNFIAAMPTNLYGIHDNFHPDDSHVIPGLIRRFHETRQRRNPSITIWGSGDPRREFLYVDDLADACLFLMQHYNQSEIINVGCGEDVSIRELAELIRDVVDYPVTMHFDHTMPDGTPRKVLDVSRINALGWKAGTSLQEGLKTVYHWYRDWVDGHD
jgi:GDP-L-fucose synthase